MFYSLYINLCMQSSNPVCNNFRIKIIIFMQLKCSNSMYAIKYSKYAVNYNPKQNSFLLALDNLSHDFEHLFGKIIRKVKKIFNN